MTRPDRRLEGHRWFAALYDLTGRLDERKLRPLRQFVAGGARGRVLELGCGTGANLPFYDWDAIESLDATEPDPFMLRRAEAKARDLPAVAQAKLTFHEAPAETIAFPDESFDAVVATLIFCTVQDVERALAEARRVLKRGSALRLFEHVRAEGFAGKIQDLVQPAWGWLGAGCHLNRRTEETLATAGFRIEVEQRLKLAVLPTFTALAYRDG